MLQEMYREWPWFTTLVDLLEMILAKSELRVAANYDEQLVHDPECRALGDDLRRSMQRAEEALLAITGHESLHCNNTLLLRSMSVRNPYVDPLNVIQAELLNRLRHEPNLSN